MKKATNLMAFLGFCNCFFFRFSGLSFFEFLYDITNDKRCCVSQNGFNQSWVHNFKFPRKLQEVRHFGNEIFSLSFQVFAFFVMHQKKDEPSPILSYFKSYLLNLIGN